MQADSFSRLRAPRHKEIISDYGRATESLLPPNRREDRRSLRDAKDSKDVSKARMSTHHISHSRGPSATSNTDRHFTIANVGHDGTIYLRPSASVSSFSAYPPAYGLPLSPPTSADGNEQQDAPQYWHDALHESAAAYGARPKVSQEQDFVNGYTIPQYPTIQKPQHRRRRSSYSFAAADGQRNSSNFDPRLLQPRARRRTLDRRSNSADAVGEMLQVPIPHYRIGTPRFSDGGHAYLRNSTATILTTDDKELLRRSSAVSITDFEKIFPVPPRRSHRQTLPSAVDQHILTPASTPPLSGPIIDSSIYDSFVADPDNARYVKYSSDGQIMAATPARLVAQITSVQFLDYELLSDFFLTYRSFLPAKDLLRYLIARLRWAVHCDGSGRIVRVRTFVALRHWILNYFLDDFEPDFELRTLFCNLLNQLTLELQNRANGGGGDSQVVGELKKCWRRTCEMVWNTKHADQALPAAHDIVPSGGSRVQPGQFGQDGILPQNQYTSRNSSHGEHAPPKPSTDLGPGTNFFSQPFFQGRHQRYGSVDPIDVASFVVTKVSPASAFRLRQESLDVTSCSIPLWKPFWLSAPNFRPRKIMPAEEKPSKKKAIGKAERPSTGRKKSGGVQKQNQKRTPSLPTPKPEEHAKKQSQSHWPTGMLIRGILVQPAALNATKDGNAMQTMEIAVDENFQQIARNQANQASRTGESQGFAPRDMMGGLRRAITIRSKTANDERPVDPRMSNKSGPIPTRAKVPVRRLEPRADMLAISVTEAYGDFARKQQDLLRPLSLPSPVEIEAHGEADATTRAIYQTKALPLPPVKMGRLNSHMTTGSRSIVIVDDTGTAESDRQSDQQSDLYDRLTPLGRERTREAPSREGYFDILPPEGYEIGNASQAALEIPERQSSLAHDLGLSAVPRSSQVHRKPVPISRDGAQSRPGMAAFSSSVTADSMPSDWSEGAHGAVPSQRQYSRDDSDLAGGSLRSSSLVDSSQMVPWSQQRQLRRRPGGNLREMDNVQDLAARPRRNSTGTISNPRQSTTTSATMSTTEIAVAQAAAKLSNAGIVSHGADPTHSRRVTKPSLRLIDSNASKPAMRASFEEEMARIAKLSQYEDNGGVDSTLAKLEGKIPPSSRVAITNPSPKEADFPLPPNQRIRSHIQIVGLPDQSNSSMLDASEGLLSPRTDTQGASIYNGSRSSGATQDEVLSEPLRTSGTSEPNRSDVSHFDDRAAIRESWLHVYAPQPRRSSSSSKKWPVIESRDFAHDGKATSHPSGQNKQGDGLPSPMSSTFLFDDSDDSSAGGQKPKAPTFHSATHVSKPSNSTMGNKSLATNKTKSSGMDSSTMGARSFLFLDDEDSDTDKVVAESTNALGITNPDVSDLSDDDEGLQHAPVKEYRHSPIPERAAERLTTPRPSHLQASRPNDEILRQIGLRDAASFPSPLPSPRPKVRHEVDGEAVRVQRSPESRQIQQQPQQAQHSAGPRRNQTLHPAGQNLQPAMTRTAPPVSTAPIPTINVPPPHPLTIQPHPQQPLHAPFILLYSSENLAKQFTLIEADALAEIDWKDLIDLKWQSAPPKVRNWVEYMRTPDQSGVDIVIARFNLVVKWAVSEILLMENPVERARTVAKFIHTAAHARRLRNYATMYQLTVALLSSSVQRLARTWSMISPSDKTILAALEQTVQPAGNFRQLRVEMEGAVHDPSRGCIPFIGIYTHDLAFNAQKPALLDPEPVPRAAYLHQAAGGNANEPLINFERFQTAAGIVKGLLRLLEASTRFKDLQPNMECLGRCLWLAALSDEEIAARGKALDGVERAQRLGLV